MSKAAIADTLTTSYHGTIVRLFALPNGAVTNSKDWKKTRLILYKPTVFFLFPHAVHSPLAVRALLTLDWGGKTTQYIGQSCFLPPTLCALPSRCSCIPYASQTLTFEYEVTDADLTHSLACSDRHALVFGFNATLGSSGYESKLRSLVAQASTNPTVAVDRVREEGGGVDDVSWTGKRNFILQRPLRLVLSWTPTRPLPRPLFIDLS